MPCIIVLSALDVESPRGGTLVMGGCRSDLCYVYPRILWTLDPLDSVVIVATSQATQTLLLPIGPRVFMLVLGSLLLLSI